jgi:hypothetical protein
VFALNRSGAVRWAKREKKSRIVRFTPQGEKALLNWLN